MKDHIVVIEPEDLMSTYISINFLDIRVNIFSLYCFKINYVGSFCV